MCHWEKIVRSHQGFLGGICAGHWSVWVSKDLIKFTSVTKGVVSKVLNTACLGTREGNDRTWFSVKARVQHPKMDGIW